jgi:hypothetical protein
MIMPLSNCRDHVSNKTTHAHPDGPAGRKDALVIQVLQAMAEIMAGIGSEKGASPAASGAGLA